MMKFIFFGRLEKEKGIDLILDVFPKLYHEGIKNRQLSVYGGGTYSKACEAASLTFPEHITFHGRQEQKIIFSRLADADYCIMPSRVIETFGLTALESLRHGTPVIGFRKGGVESFIINELDISQQQGDSNTQKLHTLIRHLCTQNIQKHSLPIGPEQLSLSEYSTDARLQHFSKIAGGNRRILIVSDFIKKFGGIENYIHDVKDLLARHGYTVELRGMNKKNSFRGLFKTALNISAWRKLRTKISHFQPDLIRYNSVVRELGWLPLTASPKKTKILMMFHDMGYFVPRPSRLYNTHYVSQGMSFTRRLRLSNFKNPIGYILSALKWLSLRLIRNVFHSRQTTYLVPSEFMKPLVEKQRQGKDQKTITLPHFVK